MRARMVELGAMSGEDRVPDVVPPTRERIVSIQVCRGLAAVVVVLAHLNNIEWKYFGTHALHAMQFGALGVDLFFVISGVVISMVTWGKFGQPRAAVRFLYHRFARVYPVYWVYSGVVLLAFLYNPLWINASAGHRVEVWRSFLLIPSGLPMLLMQGWTLSFEVYFYLVFFALLLLVPGRAVPWLLGAWALGLVGLASVRFVPPGPVSALVTSADILEFLAGCVVFRLYRRSGRGKAGLHPLFGVGLVAASLLWLGGVVWWTRAYLGDEEKLFEFVAPVRVLFYGVFSALFLFGLMEMERTRVVRFARGLAAVGDWSYSIYLCHLILLELVARGLVRFRPGVGIWGAAAISLPLVLLVGWLSYRWLERPLIGLLYRRRRVEQAP